MCHTITVAQEEGSSCLGCSGPISENALKGKDKLRLKYKQ